MCDKCGIYSFRKSKMKDGEEICDKEGSNRNKQEKKKKEWGRSCFHRKYIEKDNLSMK